MAAQILAVLLALSAVAETVSVPIKTNIVTKTVVVTNIVSITNRYIDLVQPEGKQAVVYQRINDNWRVWFTKGLPVPGGESWYVPVTNAAVKRVQVDLR